MKACHTYLGIIFLLLPFYTTAQNNPYWQEPSKKEADSLQMVLQQTSNDSLRVRILRQLALYNQESNRPAAFKYFQEQLAIAKKIGQPLWEAEAVSRIGYVSMLMQNYTEAFKLLLQARDIVSNSAIENNIWFVKRFSDDGDAGHARLTVLADITIHQGLVHYFTGDYEKALTYYAQVQTISDKVDDDALRSILWLNRGEAYLGLRKLDSATIAFNKAIKFSDASGYTKYKGLMHWDLGKILESKKEYVQAKKMYRLCIQYSLEKESLDFAGLGYQAMADIAAKTGEADSSFAYSTKAMNLYSGMHDTLGLSAAYFSLSDAFNVRGETDSAYFYLKKSIALERKLDKSGKAKQFQALSFTEQIRLQESEKNRIAAENKRRIYLLITGIVAAIVIIILAFRNNRQKQKANKVLESTLDNLKSTQSQLIQSEKMASLGELTAGIAHEIQNPLNFVNNFSEVSKELLDEMKTELDLGNLEEAKEIAADVIQNLEKISHHGKRADGIVKGMLQHSRKGDGKKEVTDINALCDEYLRLAYHGLRAKEKSFNAILNTDFDNSIGSLNIVPQDIGRVILNLITNAFYAVNEKQKKASGDYEPTVTVTTKKSSDKVEITVIDNGSGIPQKILDKIFQPFFTTKPTGEGTGLGLSLSYDIVKAHGGELKVETKDGEESEFTITLPIQ